MTTSNKLTELTKAIQTACPEILELSFGCEVFPNRDGEPWFNYKIWQVVAVNDRKLILRPSGDNIDTDLQSVDMKYIKIIGRPITLENVLQTLHRTSKNKPIGWEDYRDMFGWKFGASIDNQPKECIDFLHKLICK